MCGWIAASFLNTALGLVLPYFDGNHTTLTVFMGAQASSSAGLFDGLVFVRGSNGFRTLQERGQKVQ